MRAPPPSMASTLKRGSDVDSSESGCNTTVTGGCVADGIPLCARNSFSPEASILPNSGERLPSVLSANTPSGEMIGAVTHAPAVEIIAIRMRGNK